MKEVLLINQFASIPEMPGHTRQYETALGFVKEGWKVTVFASDFNYTKREFLKLTGNKIFLKERISCINWVWLRVFPYKINNLKRIINLLSFCIILIFFTSKKLIKNYFLNNKKLIIIASSPQLPAAFFVMILSKLFRRPFILEIRDLWPQVLIDNGKSPNSLFVKILSLMELLSYKILMQ